MAGGNLSPRQKMINLMYLVFIAMLAMNMSKQVLSKYPRFISRFQFLFREDERRVSERCRRSYEL